jgi:hypothetical protein
MFITLYYDYDITTINSRFHRFARIYYYYIYNVVFDLYTHLEMEIHSNILTL